MDFFISYLSATSTVLYQWQTLIGAVIGVMGAVAVTFIGLILNHYYQRYKELRESLRSTEVVLALAISDIFDAEENLKDFIKRLDNSVILPLQNHSIPNEYFLSETNFPPLSISFDEFLVKAQFKSYYIHNKILIAARNIRYLNKMLSEMKIKYEAIIERSKFFMMHGASPANQRSNYLENNLGFKAFVNTALEALQTPKKFLSEIKIYNLKVFTKSRFFLWKHEGVSFKFFLNKQEIIDYRGTLQCLDRIDAVLRKEIKELLDEAESRHKGTNVVKSRTTFMMFLKDVFNKTRLWFYNENS